MASCGNGGHRIFWLVEARDEGEALAQVPEWLAGRTEAVEVAEVAIP
jgi:hypothetical protein